MAPTQTFLIERPARHVGFYHREFIIDCPHGTTRVVVPNYPVTDAARGSEVFANLLDKHHLAMAEAFREGIIEEVCTCRPTRRPVASS